jgi:cyclohexanone monooxygenase
MLDVAKSSSTHPAADAGNFDVIIVGAGFSGLYLLHRMRQMGLRTRVLEAAADVGGTWYWNRYPGARCDVESMSYSYSFSEDLQQEWKWSERYATQPEILRYIEHVAERFDLRRDIAFNTRVAAAHFDEGEGVWRIRTDAGGDLKARFCIMATGCLSTPKEPEVDGIESFEGECYHTGKWPHEAVDFTGKRVAVIGTGSSAIQSVPVIAREAAHLTVFQRTAAFSVPAANHVLGEDEVTEWKANYPQLRAKERTTHSGFHNEGGHPRYSDLNDAERQQVLERQWNAGGLLMWNVFSDLMYNREANDCAADFVHRKIRSIVQDPATADALCPNGIPIGSKRLCVDSGYFETFNRDNVDLVDMSQVPIERLTSTGLIWNGTDHPFDVIVFATGFDAITGTLLRMDIRGRGGERLGDKWHAGPRAYLGLAMAGFPNMFLITGPGSPSFLAHVLVGLEQHVDWICDCLTHLDAEGLDCIEPSTAAEDGWVDHVNEICSQSLFLEGKSWYLGANVPGKPQVFMAYVGGAGKYRTLCDDVARNGYEGFILSSRQREADATAGKLSEPA